MDNPIDTYHFTRLTCRCNDITKTDIEEMGFYGVTATDPGYGQVAVFVLVFMNLPYSTTGDFLIN
jgi:hypothetical protein